MKEGPENEENFHKNNLFNCINAYDCTTSICLTSSST